MPVDPVRNDLPEQNRRFKAEDQPNEARGRQNQEPPPITVSAQRLLKRDELRLTKKSPGNPFEALLKFRRRKRSGKEDDRV
ncbi:MAG TPA: hypothetical protein DD435_07125 [Cyanobacteria bacterium UBA8530]|nr:hypothetical protein [Cyanobacteria bacterium UBA8530]